MLNLDMKKQVKGIVLSRLLLARLVAVFCLGIVISACSPSQVQSSNATKTYRYSQTTITAAAISDDGQFSLIAEPEQVCLWENQQHQKLAPCITASGAENIALLGISSSKEYFYTSNQMSVRLYRLVENGKIQQVNEWYADNNIINDIAISSDGSILLLGYRSGQASIINTQTGRVNVFQPHRLDINAVALPSDGSLAFTGSSDKTAVLWRTESGDKLRTFEHRTRVNHLDIDEKGNLGFTIDSINDRAFWSFARKEAAEISELQTNLKFLEINHSAFSPDQQYFLTGSPKQKIMLWRVNDGELMAKWLAEKIGRASVLQVAFLSSERIAILTSDGFYQEFPIKPMS